METPAWATRIAEELAAEAGRVPPRITWLDYDRPWQDVLGRRYLHRWPSGAYAQAARHVFVHRGFRRFREKLTLLHELAHWLTPGKASHSREFWVIAWGLYRRYRLPIRAVLRKEYAYRRLAGCVYLETGGRLPLPVRAVHAP